MIRLSPFDYPDFYNSSAYPGYGYYGYQPNYGRSHGFGQPLMKPVPNLCHEYGMPIEIPVIHEGSGVSTTSQENSSTAKKPRIPEGETPHSDKLPRKENQTKKQPSPKLHQKKPSCKPYATRQVSVSDMESPEDMHDDEYPFFYPGSSSEIYGDGFPFGNGFPFLASPSRSPFTNVAVNKATPQKKTAKAAPKVVNKPDDKSIPKKTDAATEPRVTAPQQYHQKVRQVPIVMENAQQQTKPQAKKPLTPMEQLVSIQKEMEAIENRVENFSGEKKDKEYIILDETMTALLLKLDTIESDGVEEIRNKRRQLVRHVQEFVQKLEAKVGIVSPAEETVPAENTMMEGGDAEMESKEDGPEMTDQVKDFLQGAAEDVDAEKAPATHHDDDEVQRPEDERQTKVDETVSSLQEMVVDNNTQTECDHTSQTAIDHEVANRTDEQLMEAGDANRTTDVEMTKDIKQVEETMETSSETETARSSENCDAANEKFLADEQVAVAQDSDATGHCTTSDHS